MRSTTVSPPLPWEKTEIKIIFVVLSQKCTLCIGAKRANSFEIAFRAWFAEVKNAQCRTRAGSRSKPICAGAGARWRFNYCDRVARGGGVRSRCKNNPEKTVKFKFVYRFGGTPPPSSRAKVAAFVTQTRALRSNTLTEFAWLRNKNKKKQLQTKYVRPLAAYYTQSNRFFSR